MKKLLAILMAAAMVAAMAACSEDKTAEDDKNADDVNVSADADADADADGENADNAEKTDIVMATNAYFKPYEYYEGDKIVGIDADIAAAIAEKLGMNLVINDMQFDSILTSVQTGAVDFGMAGMTVTDERLESVNFTSSYATAVQSVIVKEGSEITSVDDLFADGAVYTAGVQLGTTGDMYASDDLGEDRVSQFANGNEAVMALSGGAVDCVIIDNEPAKALVAANEGLVILDSAYADEEYAICVAKENTELLEKLNEAIDELIADGTVDAIVANYIK